MQIVGTDAKIRNGKGFGVQNLRQLHRSIARGALGANAPQGKNKKNGFTNFTGRGGWKFSSG